jgi:hypothetical protein
VAQIWIGADTHKRILKTNPISGGVHAPGLSFLEQATCPAIPVQTLHSHYMNAGQQKAQRVALG